MKDILLLVHDDPGQEARLQAALDITRALDGHLNCLDVVIIPVVVGYDWSGYGAAMLLEQESATEARNRKTLEQRLAKEEIAFSWFSATGDIVSSLERAALLNELVVINSRREGSGYPDMRAAASNLIVHCGKPVLAVPEKALGFHTAGRAIIAWDGSPQADAALQAALPLLRLAGHVTIAEIDDGSLRRSAEDAAHFLADHDVQSFIVRDKADRGEAGDRLLRLISQQHADYVVMGGFGHSRLSEALFGGVTRTLLTNSPIPLFLAH